MSCFSTVSAVTANGELDLTKHVNYTAGMILGVDDFTQEFAYLAGRDRWLARDALGYGTISGLSIQIETDAEKGLRVMVQPGVAVSPRGQFICVPAAQCAYLNQWLAAADVKDLDKWIRHEAGSPPSGDELTLYVTLCYRDCPTDNVPIPGEPCRNEAELSAASRVKDDFSLELRFEPPKQAEEDAVRKYVEWLKQITITESGTSTPIDDFIEAIRDEWLATSSPPITSPPEVLQIHTDDFCDYMRAAFRLWVTELRNESSDRETGCAVEMTGANKIEDCVLLAELRIPLESLSTGWKVSDTEEIEIIEENRPFLLHLRMLQEWMLCVTDHGTLTGLDRDDHKQYLLIDGSRAMTGNLDGGGNRIINLKKAEVAGQAVIFEQAIKDGDNAGGDLTGTYPNPKVVGLQGNPVSEQTPMPGEILTWEEEKWVPKLPQGDSTQFPLLLPLATIDLVRPAWFFDIWFNVDAPNNLAEIREVDLTQITPRVELEQETDPASPFLGKVDAHGLRRLSRNLFRIGLNDLRPNEISKLRFDFDIENIKIFTGEEPATSVQEYARNHNIRFLGESKNTVTIFVRVPGTLDKEVT